MTSFLEFGGHRVCAFVVARLRSLVAAAKQDDELVATPCKINSITWPVIDPQFAQPFANWPDIAERAETEPSNSAVDPGRGPIVAQIAQPSIALPRQADFDHAPSVDLRPQALQNPSLEPRPRLCASPIFLASAKRRAIRAALRTVPLGAERKAALARWGAKLPSSRVSAFEDHSFEPSRLEGLCAGRQDLKGRLEWLFMSIFILRART